MRTFTSFAAFADQIADLIELQVGANVAALEAATKLIQKHAKSKIGEYQPEAYPFAPWQDLAPSTITEKQRLGYTGQVSEDDPLLRTGEMRESIERSVGLTSGFVGSNSDVMVWQELGTRHIPPRSVLGGAAVEKADEVAEIVGEAVMIALRGEDVVNKEIKVR